MEKRLVTSRCNKPLINYSDKFLLLFNKEQQYSNISGCSNLLLPGSVIKTGSIIQVKFNNQFYDAKIVANGDQNFVNSQKDRLEQKLQEMSVHDLSFLNEKNLQLPDEQV